MLHRRREVSGYTDIGKLSIPPEPRGVVLEDRVTGTLYGVTDNTTTGGILSTTVQARWNVNAYGPFAGPRIDTLGAQVRLYVSSAVLLYEEVAFPDRASQNQIITRRSGSTRDAWQATAVSALSGGTITWTKVLADGEEV